ncbi:MAG: ABC transporter ATP-binding protein [Mollicutes bacterium]|nr:ABC transporter ATP-binding protein [Mollicutes bacterium]
MALNNVSFSLPSKGLVFVVGKSGSGKSTMLNLLGGLDSLTSGEINVFGNQLNEYSESELYSFRSNIVGFVFQDFHLLDDLTVADNVRLSLRLMAEDDDERVEKALESVELLEYKDRYPRELSGGQQQRVAIARALVKNPDVIFADEPTGNLDSNTTEQIIKLIKEISKEKLVVVVSHNLFDAYEYADRIIELSEGRIINDLVINEKYENAVEVKDNKVIIPMLKRFKQDELDSLLSICKRDEILKIEQSNNKFKQKEQKEEPLQAKVPQKKTKGLSFFNSVKFSAMFGKRRIVGFLLSAILASILICVLSLAQSIANFDAKSMAVDSMTEGSVYAVRKDLDTLSGQVHARVITDEDFAKIKQASPNAKLYKLYMSGLYINGYTIGYQKVPTITQSGLHIVETSGTLETNEEYAKKLLRLDNLDIYRGSVEQNTGGIYITDFVADSFIFYGKAENYDEILGQQFEGSNDYWPDGYVNGIINTSYKEKYEGVIDQINSMTKESPLTEEIISFLDYVNQALAISYYFGDNYKEISSANIYEGNYVYTRNFFVNGVDASSTISYISCGSYFDCVLGDNEVFMDVEAYNKIFGTEYTYGNCDTFVPHAISFLSSDFNNEVIYSKQMTVAGIGKCKGGNMLLADNVFYEYKEKMFHCYGVYADGEDVSGFINYTMDNGYSNISLKMSAIQTMSQAVETFNKFFEFIAMILVCACVFIITSFGVKNIKSKMYEVGVMKALGCKLSSFFVIFGLHTLLIAFTTIVVFVVGYVAFANVANHILLESLKAITPTKIMLDLQFIKFDWRLALINSVVVVFISIVSTIIPIILLRRIKPVTIIKAKE